MFRSDFHMHSTPFSPDAGNSMMEMASSAFEKGLDCICFTDHIDDCCEAKKGSFPPSFFNNQAKMNETFSRVRDAFSGKMNVRLGIELASINQAPAEAEKIVSSQDFDFILGSVHNVRGEQDFYVMTVESEAQARDLVRRYILEYIDTVRFGLCDVLAHIGYTHRYMHPQGYDVDLLDYSDLLTELFKKTVYAGMGIEINTSGLRDSTHQTIPSLPVLQLYRQCGGEIVTTGSDSHNVRHVGTGISEAYELMRTAGFSHVAVYKNRKPEFHRI